MELGRYIQGTKLFEGIHEKQLQNLTTIAREKSVAKGEYVFKEGSLGSEFYVIMQGTIAINKNVAGGRKRNLSNLHSGDIFGELALFDSQPRSADAEAGEETKLAVFPNDQFLELLAKDHSFASLIQRRIINVLCKRLRETDDMLNEGVIWGFSMEF
ncbi:MAG: cyclic nucleotide-binding domain-containing protein [Chitinivibrionales bacterium]|nr:cyclic nucleotide-binding domain-containing protein [Chitinivibrionales bacterium]